MQAVNLNRALIESFLALGQGQVFLFDGPVPTSLADVPFDYYNSQEVAENCVCRVDGSNLNPKTGVGNKPQGLSPTTFSPRSTYSKEFYVGPGNLTQSGVPWSYTIPGISYNAATLTSVPYTWRSMRNQSSLATDNISEVNCGTNGAWCEVYFGKEVDISNVHYRQVIDYADVPGGGSIRTYQSWARETTVQAIKKDENGNFYRETIGTYNSGVGFNYIELNQVVSCHGVRIIAARGTGASSGTGGAYAFRAIWRVRYLAGVLRTQYGATEGQSVSPTWGMMFFDEVTRYSYNDQNMGNKTFSFIGDEYNIPVALFDVGAPGSGATLELIQYPIEPGVTIQFNKFNLNIND